VLYKDRETIHIYTHIQMEEACSSKYDFIQRHFSYNTPTHEQRIQGHITDEVIFEDLPKEHFQCLPDEIQLTLVENYPHLGKYLDPEDVSPDQTIHDPLVHKKLVDGGAQADGIGAENPEDRGTD
jgi:hypothetical protein